MEECLYASIAKPGSELVKDILKNMGTSHVTLLVLLDVSAAFHTVERNEQAAFKTVSVSSIRAGDVDVTTVHSAKNLGSWFDSHLDMATYVAKTCSSAFFQYLTQATRVQYNMFT